MSIATSRACHLKKGLFTCGAAAYGACQYCGRPFCERHGVVLEDEQQICSRKVCVEKREDLARHFVFRAEVHQRNEDAACGQTGCGTRISAECTRCQGLFCAGHVHPREELVLENKVRVPRVASLCQHCWARRPLWTKR